MDSRALRRFALGAAIALAIASHLAAARGDAIASVPTAGDPPPLPTRIRDTGLYADGSGVTVQADNIAFSPQYPLWSDGATKRRWIRLPSGTAIDASRPDAWDFPPGTRLWKEFSVGRRIETRLIERLADGSWRFATYAWNAQGTDAVLVPSEGATIALPEAPTGRYTFPSRNDCLACHEGASVPVLGFSALQLSPDRDPLAAHAEPRSDEHADLDDLAARGLVRNLPTSLIENAPRIAAATPTARAALGYLHANCGHCHNDTGGVPDIDLMLAQQADPRGESVEATLASLLVQPGRFRAHGSTSARRVVPGDASASLIAMRMRSTSPLVRMPPVGVQVVDREGIELLARWIERDLQQRKEDK
jgi:hypothetical protein